MPRSRSSGALSIVSNERNVFFGLCLDSTFVIAAVNVVLPWSICPIVPMFTCGFDRSNFSLPMTARLLVLAGACTGFSEYFKRKLNFAEPTLRYRVGSVVRVQLEKLLPQLRRYLFQAGEIELADLA